MGNVISSHKSPLEYLSVFMHECHAWTEMGFSKLMDDFCIRFIAHAPSKQRCNQKVERSLWLLSVRKHGFDRPTVGRTLCVSNSPKVQIEAFGVEKQAKKFKDPK